MSDIESVKTGITETDSGLRKFFLKLGGILAVVLHPVFLFFYCFLVVHFAVYNSSLGIHFFEVFGIIFGLTVLLPAGFSLLYAKDPFLKDRRKRPLTILFTLFCYATCFLWLRSFLHEILAFGHWYEEANSLLFLLGQLIVGMLIVFYINFWFKISMHANGVGFIITWMVLIAIFISVGSLDPDSEFNISLACLIIPGLISLLCVLLLWQRVASKAHTIREVLYGLFFGFIITFLSCLLFLFGQ